MKRFKFVGTRDIHSAIQLVRSEPLTNGDVYKTLVYPANAPYLAQINVVDHVRLRAAGQSWKAIKLDLRLSKIDRDMNLETHEKFKRCSVWLSDDADRLLLRIESEVHIGSVWCELEHVDWK